MMFVYVLDIDGQPLMPTTRFGKVRRLLRDKKAKVVKRCPFTIKLLYEPETHVVQEVVLGQDTGSKHIGTACVGNDKVLYQSQVELRDDIKSKMDDRRGHRRFRRFRKTRYRKARFLNRKNSIKKDRYNPTMRSKFNAHVKEIEFCKSILPVSTIVLETAKFDTHLLKNPALVNERIKHWGYQQGANYGWTNAKAHALNRDNYTCQCCKAKHTRLEVHHIIYRSNGGSDDLENLITLCETCHIALHDNQLQEFESKLKGKRKSNLKYATQMNIIRSMLLKQYPNAIETFGFVTKANREALDLDKDHYIDAVVIASGGQNVELNNDIFYKTCVAKQNRSMCKGSRGERRIPLGKLFGFKKFDKVRYLRQDYFIKARRSSGNFVLMDVFGKSIDFRSIGGRQNPSYKSLERLNSRTSIIIERREAIPAL